MALAQQSPWAGPLGRLSLALGGDPGVAGGAAAAAEAVAAAPELSPRLTWTRTLPLTWRTEEVSHLPPACIGRQMEVLAALCEAFVLAQLCQRWTLTWPLATLHGGFGSACGTSVRPRAAWWHRLL